jgi:hypothetical protein
MPAHLAAADIQRDLVGNAIPAPSNSMVPALNMRCRGSARRSTIPWICAKKFKSRVNRGIETAADLKRFGNPRRLRAVPACQRSNDMATMIHVR